MRKYLFIVVCVLGLSMPERTNAQSFYVQADTVWGLVTNSGVIRDTIRPVGTVDLKWKVVATNFPATWLIDSVLGICDANLCRQNTANQLWNGTSGTTFPCTYPSAFNSRDFHLQLVFGTAVMGTYFMTVDISDDFFFSRRMTFIVSRVPVAANDISAGLAGVKVFPNPAKDQAHIAFDLQDAGRVECDVYDMAGRNVFHTRAVQMSAGHQQVDVPTSGFAAGMYNVVIATEKGVITERLSVN